MPPGENLTVEGASDLLGQLDPDLRAGRFVFVSLPTIPDGIAPVATVVEPEGMSIVLSADEAETIGAPFEFVGAMITLRRHSGLDTVGLTAAVSSALADAGIACNVVAGCHHDHLFVPHERAEGALAVLRTLAGRT